MKNVSGGFFIFLFLLSAPVNVMADKSPHEQGSMSGHSMKKVKKAEKIDLSSIKVQKAEGPEGRVIADIYSQRKSLKGQAVSVRGKVVKFTPGVMGKNWLHLMDGSGELSKKDFDITVTTQAEAVVGDIVLARGIVGTDKDLGSGYFYPVIIEDAKLSK